MSAGDTDPNEALVEQLVDEAIQKFRHLLPAEALEDLREQLRAFGLTHPEMRRMIDRIRPRAATDQSGPRPKDAAHTADPARAFADHTPAAAGGKRR